MTGLERANEPVLAADVAPEDCAGPGSVALEALHYSLETAVAARIDGDALDVIDVSGDAREIESCAWEWSAGLVSALRSDRGGSSDETLDVLTRGLFLSVFMPIAAARWRARAVRSRVGDGSRIRVLGAGDTDLLELEAAGFTLAQAPESSISVDPLIEAAVHRSGLAVRIRKTVRTMHRVITRDARQAVGARREARRLRQASGARDRRLVVLVLASAPVHLKLLSSPIVVCLQRGWRVVVAQMSPSVELARATIDVGAEELNVAAFQDEDAPMAELIARRITTRRQGRIAETWAESIGLGVHAPAIKEGLRGQYSTTRSLIRTHRRVLRTIRPDVVLATSEIMPAVETVIPAARQRGVPVVNVQHGSITDMPIFNRFRYDAFCVYGEAYAEALGATGTNPDAIRVTGSPYMDRVDAMHPAVARQPDGHVRILFAAGYACETASDMTLYSTLKMVLDYADEDPKSSVVVKLHPIGAGKELGYEVALSEHCNNRVRVTREDDLYDLIKWADCIATHGSTVAIEAASLRTPAVLLSPGGVPDVLPLVSEGVALRAVDAPSLAQCVSVLRAGGGPQEAEFARFDRRYAYVRDGRAGERIADILDEIAAGRSH